MADNMKPDAGHGVTLTLHELHALNGAAQTTTEFNEKWKQFGGVQALMEKLATSVKSGIRSEEVQSRRQVFGMNTDPVQAQIHWSKFKTFLRAACCDRKLLIIQVAFLVEAIPWLIAGVLFTFLAFFVFGRPGDDDEENDTGTSSYFSSVLSFMSVLVVPLVLVLAISIKNWQLQKAVMEFATTHRTGKPGMVEVFRNGEIESVADEELVVGDVYLLKPGDHIHADGILLDAQSFRNCSGQIPVTATFDESAQSTSVHFIEAGTLVCSGSGKLLVTAVGPNTRLARANSSNSTATHNFSKITEDVRFLSQKIILAGAVLGIFVILTMMVRFSVAKYAVDRESWRMSHAQRFITFFAYGLAVLNFFLQKSFPFVTTVGQFFGASAMTTMSNGRMLVKNLDDTQTLGSVSVLINFIGKLPPEIVQKFTTAGIRVLTLLELEAIDETHTKYESRSLSQLMGVQRLIYSGEFVAVLGHTDMDRLALEQAHCGILVSPNAISQATIKAANIIIKPSSEQMRAEGLELILKCINRSRSTIHNFSKFIQLLIPAVLVVGIIKVIQLVATDVALSGGHLLWISLVVFVVGVTFVHEAPIGDTIFVNSPSDTAKCSLVSKIMLRNIVGQIVYQLIVALVIQFRTSWVSDRLDGVYSHYGYEIFVGTLLFNAITLMTLFNAINCRVIRGEVNIFTNILGSSKWFCIVWLVAGLVHFVVAQWGDLALVVTPLTVFEWLACYAFAMGTLLWQQLVNVIPIKSGRVPTAKGEVDATAVQLNLISDPSQAQATD